jgi:hypothetical protein
MRSTPKKLAVPVLLAAFATIATATIGPLTASAAPDPVASASSVHAAEVRADIAKRANGEVGTAETGDNCNPYGPCESWCALFATWVWRKSGIDIPQYAFTGDIYNWGKQKGRAHSGDTGMKVGDIVLYGTGPDSVNTSVHTGVVVAVSGGKITTVEGNSGDKVSKHGPFDPQHAKDAGRPANIYGWVSAG